MDRLPGCHGIPAGDILTGSSHTLSPGDTVGLRMRLELLV
jgi:hypothetical protein